MSQLLLLLRRGILSGGSTEKDPEKGWAKGGQKGKTILAKLTIFFLKPSSGMEESPVPAPPLRKKVKIFPAPSFSGT